MKSRETKYKEAVSRNMRRLDHWISTLTEKGKRPDPKVVAHKLGVRTSDTDAMRVIHLAVKPTID